MPFFEHAWLVQNLNRIEGLLFLMTESDPQLKQSVEFDNALETVYQIVCDIRHKVTEGKEL